MDMLECVLDNFRNIGKANCFFYEALDGNFVGGVIDGSAIGFLFKCLVGEL